MVQDNTTMVILITTLTVVILIIVVIVIFSIFENRKLKFLYDQKESKRIKVLFRGRLKLCI